MTLSKIATRLAPLFLALAAATASPSLADTIYQSATYTGNDTGEYIVQEGRSIGVAFTLSHKTQITDIGAQFGGFPGGAIFAAIVPLSSLSAYPAGDASDLAAIDLAHTVFSVPTVTAIDQSQPLSVTLEAGAYALIFGSGQFGATGFAGLGFENDTVGSPVMFQTLFDNTWQSQDADGIRIFVNGAVVPEPATWALMIGGLGLAGAALRRRRTACA